MRHATRSTLENISIPRFHREDGAHTLSCALQCGAARAGAACCVAPLLLAGAACTHGSGFSILGRKRVCLLATARHRRTATGKPSLAHSTMRLASHTCEVFAKASAGDPQHALCHSLSPRRGQLLLAPHTQLVDHLAAAAKDALRRWRALLSAYYVACGFRCLCHI